MGFSKNAVFLLDSMINWPTESNPGVNFCVSLADQNLISTAHLYSEDGMLLSEGGIIPAKGAR